LLMKVHNFEMSILCYKFRWFTSRYYAYMIRDNKNTTEFFENRDSDINERFFQILTSNLLISCIKTC
jgi:hypothetical protein